MKRLLLLFFASALIFSTYSCRNSRTEILRNAPVKLEQSWATEPVLRTPESVLPDAQRNILYVSNINTISESRNDGDGFISKITTNGVVEQLYWVTGLNDPRGMALFNNVLYIADKSQIVTVSAETGAIIGRHDVPGAKYLNDVVADATGTVYVSDSETRKIYLLRNGSVNIWIDNTQNEKPNGLLLEANQMTVAYMSNGNVNRLNTETRTFTDWQRNIPSADGIVADTRDGYFISNWNGEVYYIDRENKQWLVLDTKAQNINSADIGFSSVWQTLYVPTFNNNRVVAYRVVYSE